MYPGIHAQEIPDKPATIMGASGEVVTYGELDTRSNRCAHLFRSIGLKPHDTIAMLVENRPEFFDLCWAAQRSGLVYVPMSTYLHAEEIAYIVKDCGAGVLVASSALAEAATGALERTPGLRGLSLGGDVPGFERLEEALAGQPDGPIDDEVEGIEMLYSSGTTGYPKGIRNPLSDRPIGTPTPMVQGLIAGPYGIDRDTVYLSPAPLYHSAPLRFTMALHRVGATNVVMERFDPRLALSLVERHRVTVSQWVPTMFVRMLKLPEEERLAFDLSSQQVALHAAAPCPVPVKEQMIEWWGPILYEYYAATEGNGSTQIDSHDWLKHKGSVGRPSQCTVHVLDDDGVELPTGEVGTLWFDGGGTFSYHNDPEKTSGSFNELGWSTVGDMGYVDAEGYVYLTDRKANMIISGGVNVYPQETENFLILHPKVADVAVFGVPSEEFGEEVKAVVQPADPKDAGPALENELIEYCREALSHIKCPRSVDFEDQLPRADNGKLYKRMLRERYWRGHGTRIV